MIIIVLRHFNFFKFFKQGVNSSFYAVDAIDSFDVDASEVDVFYAGGYDVGGGWVEGFECLVE